MEYTTRLCTIHGTLVEYLMKYTLHIPHGYGADTIHNALISIIVNGIYYSYHTWYIPTTHYTWHIIQISRGIYFTHPHIASPRWAINALTTHWYPHPPKNTIRTPDGIVPIIHYTRYTIQIPYEIYYWHRSWRLAVTLHMAHYYTYPKWERLFVPHRA